jgi:hypothetical protein
VLIYQDEMEIHRHPALARMWAPVGQQPEIPAPGKNEKRVVYGGVDYRTGKLRSTIAARKGGASFLAFLAVLLVASAGRKIRLVCDKGRFHTTKAAQRFWAAQHDKIEGYWLPPLLSQPQLDRTVVGSPQAHGVSHCPLRHHCRPRDRRPERSPAGTAVKVIEKGRALFVGDTL